MTELARAITIACAAHRDQKDKNGDPYIFHILRVLDGVRDFDEDYCCAAVLHDVIEDSELDASDLGSSYEFNDTVVAAVEALTRRKDESYMDFIDRCRANKIARLVKQVDIRDNQRPSNDVGHVRRQEKYAKALQRLLSN